MFSAVTAHAKPLPHQKSKSLPPSICTTKTTNFEILKTAPSWPTLGHHVHKFSLKSDRGNIKGIAPSKAMELPPRSLIDNLNLPWDFNGIAPIPMLHY